MRSKGIDLDICQGGRLIRISPWRAASFSKGVGHPRRWLRTNKCRDSSVSALQNEVYEQALALPFRSPFGASLNPSPPFAKYVADFLPIAPYAMAALILLHQKKCCRNS